VVFFTVLFFVSPAWAVDAGTRNPKRSDVSDEEALQEKREAGSKLRVLVAGRAPFVLSVVDSDQPIGLSIGIWKAVAGRLNLE
jgi:hypothetical protein